MNAPEALCAISGVTRAFRSAEGQALLVLDQIDLTINSGEIVALLGKSGAGKSTLLRVIAGLLKPSSGDVSYRGKKVSGPVKEIAMVFQNFALFPWLTVLQNVELGLEALGVPKDERRRRALKTIDNIGLDGFESAYPKELSGGMRQRVGFARALVVEPELLLMDEPFSSLDVLTAERLRGDLIDLWNDPQIKTKGILFVTHNIEEAALIADRIIVFGSDPGHIKKEIKVQYPLPRNPVSTEIRQLVDDLYSIMTSPERETIATKFAGEELQTELDIWYRIPDAETDGIIGLVDALYSASSEQTQVDLPLLAESLHMDAHKLFTLTETLSILKMATVSQGDIALTPIGRRFAESDILERKRVFAYQLIQHVPLAKHIRTILDTKSEHRENEDVFLSVLRTKLSDDESERVLKVIIDWGRYAEIFAYDYDSGDLSLENPG